MELTDSVIAVYETLVNLAEQEHPVRVSQARLADLSGYSKQTVKRAVEELTERGFVRPGRIRARSVVRNRRDRKTRFVYYVRR